MILRPGSLKELDELLKKIPEEKKKTIVFCGRHRREKTHRLAEKHHKSWENNGAVAVLFKKKWTPHGVWKKIKARGLLEKTNPFNPQDWTSEVLKITSKVPSDGQIVQYLRKKRHKQPMIHFHATPAKPGSTPMVQGIVEPEGALEIVCPKGEQLIDLSRFEKGKSVHINKAKDHEEEVIVPGSLCVEFHAQGDAPTKKLLNDEESNNAYQRLYPRPWAVPNYLSRNYVQNHCILNRNARRSFRERFNAEFIKLLAYLAECRN